MINSFFKKLLTGSALMFVLAANAQNAANTVATPAAASASENSLVYLLISAAAILLLAIVLLGNVLVKLTGMAIDKRMARAAGVLLLLLVANFAGAQGTVADASAGKPFELGIRFDVFAGAVVLAAELMVVLWMLLRINSLLTEISGVKKKPFSLNIHLPHLFDNINASVAVEKEQDILLDHNYDGIRELDNALPPWWKYSFYLSIIWAFFYLGYYYFGGGPSSTDEYLAEVQQAKIDVEAYNKKNALVVDENNIKLADAAGILDGQDIFKNNCAACHGNSGEGNVGPNLTDNYWLHGNSLNEIFKTVKYGWPAKGMKSWEADLSAVQIRNVVSYIHSLHGTNPANAKAPQGDLIEEGTLVITDSTGTNKTDSGAVVSVDTLKK